MVAVFGNRLSVRLHVALLEVVGKLVEVLVVWQECVSLRAVEVVVPDSQYSQNDRQVLLEGSCPEMLVHAMGTLEQLLKVVVANDESNRESDGTPQAVSSTDPVPELEHVLLGDTELGDGLGICAQCDEVLRDMGLVLSGTEEPIPRARSVGDGFLGGERLGSNYEQSCFGVAETKGLSKMGAIDVGHEVGSEIPLGVCLQCFGNHDGTQVRTTNTDVDDGVDSLASVTFPDAISNRL